MNALVPSWNRLADWCWASSLEAAWQGLIVLVFVLAVLLIWRKAPPVWRYGLFLLCLVKLAVPPVGLGGIGLFPWLESVPAAHWALQPSFLAASHGPQARAGVKASIPQAVSQRTEQDLGDVDATAPTATSTAIGAPPVPHASDVAAGSSRLTGAGWTLAVHVFVVLALSIWLVKQAWGNRCRLRNARRLETGLLAAAVREVSRELGLRRQPTCYSSPDVQSPQVGGLLRPVILLPAWADGANQKTQRILVAHELAHLRRHDAWVNGLQILIQLWLWWDPLVWWLNARIRRERELCCDDLVLARGLAEGPVYAKVLVDLADSMRAKRFTLEAVGMAGAFSGIASRVRRTLDTAAARRTGLSAAGCIVLLLCGALVLPGARPAQATDTSDGEAPESTATADGKTEATRHGWSLRLKTVDAEGRPVAGVRAWRSVQGMTQVPDESFPLAWADIAHSGRGTDRAGRVNWFEPHNSVSSSDGILTIGALPITRRHDCVLYHPDYLVVAVQADPSKQPPDGEGVVDLGKITLSEGHSVRGVVSDTQGKPIADAWVVAQPTRTTSEKDTDGTLRPLMMSTQIGHVRAARSNVEGRFRLRGLDAMAYVVASWTDIHPPHHAVVNLTGISASERRSQMLDFVLEPFREERVQVIEVRQGDGEGMPVPGIPVQVNLAGSGDVIGLPGLAGLAVYHGETDTAGRVTIRNLPDGVECRAWVGAPQETRWCSGRFRPGGKQVAHFRFGPLDLHVEGTDGAIAGCFCKLECVDSGRASRSSWSRGIHVGRQRSGPWFDGARVQYPRLACGTWRFTLWAPGYEVVVAERKVTTQGVRETLRLPPGRGILKGRVYEKDSGKPLNQAQVLIRLPRFYDWTPERCIAVKTRQGGRYEYWRMPAADQTLKIRIEEPAHLPVEFDLQTKEGTYTDRRELEPAGWLCGKFVVRGVPAPDVTAHLWSVGLESKSTYRGEVVSNRNGEWTSGRLKPGMYTLAAGRKKALGFVTAGSTSKLGEIELHPHPNP